MKTSKHCFTFWSWLALLAIASLGCAEKPKVVVQERTSTQRPARRFNLEAERMAQDHILAAYVVHDDFAWFFKLSAPTTDIEKLREEFATWLSTVEFVHDEKQKADVPKWKNPSGWFDAEGGPGQYATIRIPSAPAPLSLGISRLPYDGRADRFLEMNVNRWLRQLGQSPLDKETIKQLAKQKPAKSDEATFVELVGRFVKPPAWRNAQPQSQEFTYDAPDGWQPGPTNSMRRVVLVKLGEGEDQEKAQLAAAIVVTNFPANNAMSDPLENTKRWAGQAGIKESDEELLKRIKARSIAGIEGKYIRLIGEVTEDDEKATQATPVIAALCERDGMMWFFKLTGAREAVITSEADFKLFLDSFQFRDPS